MKKLLRATFFFILIFSANSSRAEISYQKISSPQFKLEYPGNWKIWDDRKSSGSVAISLIKETPQGKAKAVDLTFMPYFLDPKSGLVVSQTKDSFKENIMMEIESLSKINSEKEITVLGKLKGHGIEIVGSQKEGSILTLISFMASLDDAEWFNKKLPQNLKGRYLMVTGYFVKESAGKPVLTPEEQAGLDHLLNSVEITTSPSP